MANLSIRSTLPEKMDQANVEEKEIRQALHELEVINKYLGGYNVILKALQRLNWTDRNIIIADIGCGGGDMLRAISKWANQNQKQVQLIGIDMNPVMTSYAIEKSNEHHNISYATANVFDDSILSIQADIVTCSLFCHHFNDEDLIKMILRMHQLAKKTIIINDLHRHWFAYYSINILTTLFSRTYLVKYDAKLSVARALIRKEWENILNKAGLKNYSIKWRWAWRWEIIIEK